MGKMISLDGNTIATSILYERDSMNDLVAEENIYHHMPPSNCKSASVRKTTATIETKQSHIQSLNKKRSNRQFVISR